MVIKMAQVQIVPSMFVITEHTTGVTHSDTIASAGEQTMLQYQVPSGTTLAFGGNKASQRFMYAKAQNATPAAVAGVYRLYKLSADKETVKLKLGEYHTGQTSASASDKQQMPDIGNEPLRSIKTDEWLIMTFTPDTATDVYIAANSDLRVEMNKLSAISLE